MKNNMEIKQFNKEQLLKDICNWYNYKLTIKDDGKIICDATDIDKDLYFENEDINSALIDWYETLTQSNADSEADGGEGIYKDEIAFIKSIKNNVENKTNSKLELGKKIADSIKGEDFYEWVKWDNISDERYETMAEKLMLNMNEYLDFVKYAIEDNLEHYSDSAYDLVKEIVEKELEKDYWYNEDYDRFIERKTLNMACNLLNTSGIYYNFSEDCDTQLVIELPNNDIIYIDIDDEGAYLVDYNHSTKECFDEDMEFIEHVTSLIDNEEDFAEDAEEKDIMNNTIEVKYDVQLEFESKIQDTFVIKVKKPLVIVEDMVGESNLLIVEKMLFEKHGDKYCLTGAEGKYPVPRESIRYFIGVNSEELYETCHRICEENEIQEVELIDANDLLELKNKYSTEVLENYEQYLNITTIDDTVERILNYCCCEENFLEIINMVNKLIGFCNDDIEVFEFVSQKLDYDFDNFNDRTVIINSDFEDFSIDVVDTVYEYDNDLYEYIDFESVVKEKIDYEEKNGAYIYFIY